MSLENRLKKILNWRQSAGAERRPRLVLAALWFAAGFAVPVCAQVDDPRLLTCVAFGDSTTAPRNVNGKPLDVYAGILEARLAGEGVIPRVLNRGAPGDTTADARLRLARDVLAVRPDIVIVQFGINDAAIDVWKKPPATTSRVPAAEFASNLTGIVRQLKGCGAEVVLMTPNPVRWTDQLRKLYAAPPYDPADPDSWNILMGPYVAVVKRIADLEKVRLVDVYEAFLEYGRVKGQSVDDLLLDGMHPNGKGHRLVADLILGCLNEN